MRHSLSVRVIAIFSCLAAPSLAATPTTATAPAADSEQIDVLVGKTPVHKLPEALTFRARVTKATPSAPADISWRYGGEGQGGESVIGSLAKGLAIGEWSPTVSLASLAGKTFPPPWHYQRWFITLTLGGPATTSAEAEFEFFYNDKLLKRFRAAAPDGATIGLVVPYYRLEGGAEPTNPDFVAELGTVLEYAVRRAEMLEKLPWASWPLPKKLSVVTDVSGYGKKGYGARHSDPAVTEAECRTLRQLGVNGLRSAPAFLLAMADRREGFGKDFAHARITSAMGYPVGEYRKGKPAAPEAGCPYGSGVAAATEQGVAQAVKSNLAVPVDEVYALTVDEIGTVMDRTPEGKAHMNTCPRCAAGFREYLKSQGATPADVGAKDWDEVVPFYGDGPAARYYYSRKFNNYASARLFTPLMTAFDQANQRKRQALTGGLTDSPEAKQPWIYSYALRGNTFLLGGHSLDFHDFYRQADNAFIYETSNRGPQIWGWDSYLCDVGRVNSEKMGKVLGIYVKPHRGAPVQRALTAVARGAHMLYWYTYGPEYFKGDSFADRSEALVGASKAAHIIGSAEDVLYGARWAVPAQVAVVKPTTSEYLGSNAAWENAKWVYTALTHAHIPVDPVDETMLVTDDLSRYKIIYVNGSHITKASAEKLAAYVAAGGTLWTSGWGCACDEANQPLAALAPVLGLAKREKPEMWYNVDRYGAGGVQNFADKRKVLADVPADAAITGKDSVKGTVNPIIGREILQPAEGSQVLATFANGQAAATRHPYGKGQAYVVGFFPGLEYSAGVRGDRFDMLKGFLADAGRFITAPARDLVQPVVDNPVGCVEGVLLQNPDSGKRAVVLMNWAYRVSAVRRSPEGKTSPVVTVAEVKDLPITLRGAGPVTAVRSVMLQQSLAVESGKNGSVTVKLPELAEGDVLLLE